MIKSKHIDKICAIVLVLALLVTVLFMNGEQLGLSVPETTDEPDYENTIFDTSYVHTINIVMDASDWSDFLENATDEEYVPCTVVIDGEKHKDVGLRAKGNTSLSQVAAYGNDRYSFKIEFDHYVDGKTLDGLDKLALNNLIQDNTCMKDYLCYTMMNYMGADSPLCSYAWVTVNGEDFGLYLAVESVEDSFISRVYGENASGDLYKPDTAQMGGGRGNGADFDIGDFTGTLDDTASFSADAGTAANSDSAATGNTGGTAPTMPGNTGGTAPTMPDNTGGTAPTMPGGQTGGDMGGNGMGGMGSSDVALVYSDDSVSSYSNIFDNAKTSVSSEDEARLIASIKQLNEGTELDEVVDTDEVLRYFAVHNFVLNFDSYTGSMMHNYYLYEENGVMSMIAWDYNLAFGAFAGGDSTACVNFPIDTPVSGDDNSSRPMLGSLLADEQYLALYHSYLSELVTDFFDSGRFSQLIDDTEALIAPYVQKDENGFCTYDEFETGVAALKEFCTLRAESVTGQLNGTIPSTDDGQTADSSALIDASGVSISDMGSMGMGGGNGGGATGFSQQSASGGGAVTGGTTGGQGTDAQSGATTSSDSSGTQGTTPPSDSSGTQGTTPPTGGFQPDSSGDSQGGAAAAPGSDTTSTVSSGISGAELFYMLGAVALLAAGILFAAFYRRRR